MDIERILANALGPYEKLCAGFAPHGLSSYVCAVTLSSASVQKRLSHEGSRILDDIIAFDLAEASGAYTGQINVVKASSFCGFMGLVWGYDLCKPADLRSTRLFDITGVAGAKVPVYSAAPLVKAATALFGRRDRRHFPIAPGAVVPCAEKNLVEEGPAHIYSAVGIGIPIDREKAAIVWMEDVGFLSGKNAAGQYFVCPKEALERKLAESVLEVGGNQGVEYQEILVLIEERLIPRDSIGCALVLIPYLTLAQHSQPSSGVQSLLTMSLDEWINDRKAHFFDVGEAA